MIAFAVILVAVVYGATRLLSDYLRRSARSFASAQRAWGELNKSLNELVESDVSATVAQLAILTASVTGCGCLVRGVLISHYLPRVLVAPKPPFERAFASVNELAPHQKKLFDHVMVGALVYDSFRNPLQGWFFRRMLRSSVQPQPTYSATLETQLATAAVLSRRKLALAA